MVTPSHLYANAFTRRSKLEQKAGIRASGARGKVSCWLANTKLKVADIQTKKCTMCKEIKPISGFRSRGGSMTHLLKSRCNSCLYKEHLRWTKENEDRVREYRGRDKWTIVKRCKRHGISPQILIEAYEEQGGHCPICEMEMGLMNSAIDHNHATGEFRGVLYKKCNRALGMFYDSENVLSRAIEYLKKKGNYATR